MVVWWDGWLILLEAKCTKSIFTAYDAYRGRESIEKAARQLVIRRDVILADWPAFRAAARDLNLPETVVARDRIALIAITNIPHFTSQRIGDVVVTDDVCLQRFFSDPAVTLESGDDDVAVLGHVRPVGAVTPTMLFEYLAAPLQVRAADAGLKQIWQRLPAVDEQSSVIVMRTTYNPPLVDVALRILSETSGKVPGTGDDESGSDSPNW